MRLDSTLRGFELDLGRMIAAGFRWADAQLRDRALVLGRNVFDKYMPDAADIALTAKKEDNGFNYDPTKEPTLCIYRQPGRPWRQSVSGDTKVALNQLLVLRAHKPAADAVDLLDDLVAWLRDNGAGLSGDKFVLGSVAVASAPSAFNLAPNQATYASALLNVLAKPRKRRI